MTAGAGWYITLFMNTTYTLNTSDVAQFNKLLANANKKASKLGVEGLTAVFGQPRQVEYTERNLKRYVEVVDVSITGATPKYAGWKLVGVVSPLKSDSGEILPIVTTVPGEHISSNGQARDPLWCDHCKVRRDRLESFIVQHEDGTEKQVGRNCLTDFLGDSRMSPAGLAGLMNTIASISDSVAEWHRGPRQFSSESLTLVLACTQSVIRIHGWVSSKEAFNTGKTATKNYVSGVMNAFLTRPEEPASAEALDGWRYNHRYIPRLDECMPTAEDFAKSATYREHLEVLLDSKDPENDYFQALRILAFAGTVNRKAMGIAVSIVPLVDRETNEVTDPVKAKLNAAAKTSQYVGAIRKRQVFKDLMFIENFHTGAGYSIATFVDPNGNIIKTFSSQCLLRGQVVDVKATPQRHDEYKGVKNTVVNRLVVV